MSNEFVAGTWVRRPGQTWHLVQSDIDDAAITKCGRRMNAVTSRGRLRTEPGWAFPSGKICSRCWK